MRKIDYETLADVIGDEIRSAETWLSSNCDAENQAIARARSQTAERIARSFASRAHVDRLQFLNACGIDTR